ncbi:MAG: D-alanyl-D-alanine carboxypeptidase/D-alanyl-D-alanine-endopeptidase [Flavobacteriaceae bacterium]
MMKFPYLTLILVLIWHQLPAQKTSRSKLQKTIAQIEAFQQAQIGIQLRRLTDGKLLASWQAERYFTPASNTKLLTILAAVQTFDSLPALRYTIDSLGTTHFQATGYPLLAHPFYPDMSLIDFLQKQDSLVYHTSNEIDLNQLGAGWSWDDGNYYFSAIPSAFPIYGNVIQTTKSTTNSKLTHLPNLGVFTENKSITRGVERMFYNNFSVNPSKIASSDTLYTPFLPSELLTLSQIETLLNKKIQHTNSPLDQGILLNLGNDTKLYQAVLQNSDNLIAENLLLMVGKQKHGNFSVAETIAQLKKEWQFAPDPWVWVDGSGLSRYNLITPRNLIWVLQQLYQELDQLTIQTYFPQAGVSGTIKRFYSSTGLPLVFAKTGTLRNNHNLSGFLVDSENNWYAFSIMVNQHTATTYEVRTGIRELLEVLTRRFK